MTSVDEFLKVIGPKEKIVRTSFDLSTKNYEVFKAFCKEKGVTVSELLDRLIRDFNETHRPQTKDFVFTPAQ